MSNTAKIENYQQYMDALRRIEALAAEVSEDMPEEDPRKIEYRVLSELVADYSDTHFDLGVSHERQYLNEAHRAYSEACQKEVEEMAEQPLTHEQFLQQIAEQNRESELGN